jgi:hypothetical protein
MSVSSSQNPETQRTANLWRNVRGNENENKRNVDVSSQLLRDCFLMASQGQGQVRGQKMMHVCILSILRMTKNNMVYTEGRR